MVRKILAMFFLVCFSTSALAQTEQSVDELVSRAKAEFDKKNYAEAVSLLKAAYEKKQNPRFIYNIARAYEELGDLKNAIMYFEIFAAKTDKLEDKVSAKKKVKELTEKAELEKKKNEVKIEKKSGEEEEPIGEKRSDEVASSPVDKPLEEKPGRGETQPQSGKSSHSEGAISPAKKEIPLKNDITEKAEISASPNIWPWIALGSGAAIAGAGAVFHVLAFNHYGNARDADENASDYESYFKSEYGKAKDYQTVSFILYGAGAAAMLTGAILLLTSNDENETTFYIAPDFNNGYAAIYGTWRF
ncbi:MAG: hypothetical protein FJ088_07740 [Deltaproteobacteria bacterium]|nr:hypothetical protein [Deltaproteobacteria bacterium]